jgi:hypothetical protein
LLSELADWTRTDKRINLDRNAGALRDFDHRSDVTHHRATGAGDAEIEFVVGDFAAHPENIIERSLTRSRQSDVGDVDSDLIHQVDELQLLLDVRISDARVLESVAQRLVEEGNSFRDDAAASSDLIPVIDQLVVLLRGHGASLCLALPDLHSPVES